MESGISPFSPVACEKGRLRESICGMRNQECGIEVRGRRLEGSFEESQE